MKPAFTLKVVTGHTIAFEPQRFRRMTALVSSDMARIIWRCERTVDDAADYVVGVVAVTHSGDDLGWALRVKPCEFWEPSHPLQVFVPERFRRCGIGKACVDRLLSLTSHLPLPEVWTGNDSSQAFWHHFERSVIVPYSLRRWWHSQKMA